MTMAVRFEISVCGRRVSGTSGRLLASAAATSVVLAALVVAGPQASAVASSATASGCAPTSPTVSACNTVRLSFTGGPQQFTVPDGVTELGVLATGGNGGEDGNLFDGGLWGEVGGTLPVSPGDVLSVLVGGLGGSGTASGGGGSGGYDGGGAGGNGAGGGGGATVVSDGSTVDFVAGGGGGAGWFGPDAGDGGGDPAGQSGNPSAPSGLNGGPWDPITDPGESGPGLGGTQSTGGGAGATSEFNIGFCVSTATATPATSGAGPANVSTPGAGGAGGSYPMDASCDYMGQTVSCQSACGGGGGGGGGYFGGGGAGGGQDPQGGGGGSSYIAPSVTDIGGPILGGPSIDNSGNGSVRFYYLPCGATSAGATATAGGTGNRTASKTCPLTVKVSGQLAFTSGLTHRPVRNPDVARFFSETSGTSQNKCQSGCTDLTVTVTNPANHNKPVEGAKVDASVQALPGGGIAPYPSGEDPGSGYLCVGGGTVASAANCGDGSRELIDHTDVNGQVKLRYWAPGVLTEEKVLLTVKASDDCTSSSSCPTGHLSGEDLPNPTLTVKPNVLIGTSAKAKSVELDAEQAKDLAKWTASASLSSLKDFLRNQGIEHLLSTAIEKALEAEAEGPVAIAAILHEYNSINLEEQGFMALILNKFNIRERGLGVTSPDTFHKVGPTPGRDFLLKFASDNGQFNIDKGGLTWRYGKELAKLPKIGVQTMNLRVTEVSYCSQGEECGPGYSGSGKEHYAGIHPYLYFQFVADRGPEGSEFGRHPVLEDSFIVPYSAEAWMQTQFGG